MFEVLQKPYQNPSFTEDKLTLCLNQLLAREEIGFFRSAERVSAWQESQKLAEEKKKSFSNLMVIGVGGSSLGARALDELKKTDKVFFIDNVDPFAISETLKQVDLNKTFFCFISKSGTTIETLGTLEVLNKIFIENGRSLYQQSVVITEDKKNSLKKWADTKKVPCLFMPEDVGGRFSVLTSVGLFPAAWMGYQLEELRTGAMEALNEKKLLVSLAQQYLESFQKGKLISVFWFYSSQYHFFGAWLQQLWAESLAKLTTRSGAKAPLVSTPLVAIGSTDQHSLLQQMMQGHQDKLITLFKVAAMETASLYQFTESQFLETEILKGKSLGHLIIKQAEATAQALSVVGNPVMLIEVNDLSDRSVGFQFMLWMMVVGLIGEALEINAFDQPGVELGKVLTREKLL
jgi:glucose-6-phosphate isomerase